MNESKTRRKQMKYKDKKSGIEIARFEIMDAKKAMGVTSMGVDKLLVGIGTDGIIYPQCIGEDEQEKQSAQIKSIIEKYFDIID